MLKTTGLNRSKYVKQSPVVPRTDLHLTVDRLNCVTYVSTFNHNKRGASCSIYKPCVVVAPRSARGVSCCLYLP